MINLSMTNTKTIKSSLGFGLVEVVIGAAIITVSLLGIVRVFGYLTQISNQYPPTVQAAFLVEETAEAARVLRDLSWSNIANWPSGDTYRLVFESGAWSTTASAVLVDGKFDRTLTIAPAYRDGNQNLVLTGGVEDPDARLLTARVSWNSSKGVLTKELSFYLTNLFNE